MQAQIISPMDTRKGFEGVAFCECSSLLLFLFLPPFFLLTMDSKTKVAFRIRECLHNKLSPMLDEEQVSMTHYINELISRDLKERGVLEAFA